MGLYIYSLKKASRKIKTDQGIDKVQHFSYSYKDWSGWTVPASFKRMEGRVNASADRAFEEYKGGYIVTCDVKDEDGKLTDLDGVKVYKDLPCSTLYDDHIDKNLSYVGTLKKEGRSYVLSVAS
jgi:hypothetical protein